VSTIQVYERAPDEVDFAVYFRFAPKGIILLNWLPLLEEALSKEEPAMSDHFIYPKGIVPRHSATVSLTGLLTNATHFIQHQPSSWPLP
jgi:hypothetical protein